MNKVKEIYYKILNKIKPEVLFWTLILFLTSVLTGVGLLGNCIIHHFHPEWQYFLY